MKKEDRYITQLYCMRAKIVESICEIDKTIDYLERLPKSEKMKDAATRRKR